MIGTAALDEPGLEGALENLKSVLIPEETLEAWAVQRRVFALSKRRLLLAATSGRLLSVQRRLIGGFDIEGFRWQDLEEVTLSVGLLGARIAVRVGKAADLASDGAMVSRRLEFLGLRKLQAQAVYRVCQAQDQAWREKRRIRELEELRARSGGIQVSSGGALGGAASPDVADSVRRLQEAKQLVDAKLITDSEYEAIKAKIVSST
jgi:hypothetical protein